MRLWERILLSICVAIILFVCVVLFSHLVPKVAPPWPGQDAAAFLTSLAEILRAIQWPLVALIVAYFFRKDIAELLTRIARWKGLGMEIETREQVDDATAAAALWQANAEAQTQGTAGLKEADGAIPSEQLPLGGLGTLRDTPEVVWARFYDSNIERITGAIRNALSGGFEPEGLPQPIAEAQQRVMNAVLKSPEIALRVVAGGITNLLERLSLERGLIQEGRRTWAPTTLARLLRQDGVIDHWAEDAIIKFFRAADAVLKEDFADEDDVLKAIDAGMAILGGLSHPFRTTIRDEEPAQHQVPL